ncbi:MAG: HAMP domain-containing protein [Nitriliruptorales bacterium]|nr:HAMP domain-containing protein [Nitriliruptorales bacterium]
MRKRLLLSTLAAVATAVVLLGLPLAFAVGVLAERNALDELQRDATGVLATLGRENDPRVRSVVLQSLAREGRRYILFDRVAGDFGLATDTAGDQPRPSFDHDERVALRTGQAARAYDDGTLAVSVPVVRDGQVTQLLRVLQSEQLLKAQIHNVHLSIAGLAAASLGVAMIGALWQGRRFATPLEDLAASARRLGDGDFSARAPRSGLPEPDQVAAALDSTATRLAAMLERSRSFSADASHQLRTPLTALRLDLEALDVAGAEPGLVAAAVAEADRLEATIDELLALAGTPAGDEYLDLEALAGERIEAWRALARTQGRDVRLEVRPVPLVRARAAALGQSLQVLLDNALEHGTGTVTVSVREVAGGVRLCVGDEGPGIPDGRKDVLFKIGGVASVGEANGQAGGGRGLPLARSLVEAEGGRLTLEKARPGAVVCLLLPAEPRLASGVRQG